MQYSQRVKWLVEQYIHDDDPRLVTTLEELGYEVKIIPHEYKLEMIKHGGVNYLRSFYPKADIVVVHCSIQFAKYVIKYGGHTYQQFLDMRALATLGYIFELKDYVLNRDYVYLPLWEIFERGVDVPIFVRPDSPFKEFPGMIIEPGMDLDTFTSKYGVGTNIRRLLTLLAKPQTILKEARYVVTLEDIVTASYYKIAGEIVYQNIPYDEDSAINQYVRQLIEKRVLWQAIGTNGGVVVVDIAQLGNSGVLENDFKIIELGSVMTSSLYEADFVRFVESVSKLAHENVAGANDGELFELA